MFDISGKVALITGGIQGIGLATVKELFKNGLKAIAILDINEQLGRKVVKDVQHEFGEKNAIFVKVNIADRNEYEEAFKTVVRTFNALDIVINNAGIYGEIQWEKTIGVNFVGTTNGTLLAFEHFLPIYKSAEEGVILNVASRGAFVFCPHIPAYGASKFGILSLSHCLGQSANYEKKKVRVMAVAPAATGTQMYPSDDSKLLNDEYREIPIKLNYPAYHHIFQKAENVAIGIINVIKEGKNGSLWIIEDDEPPHETSLTNYQKIMEQS